MPATRTRKPPRTAAGAVATLHPTLKAGKGVVRLKSSKNIGSAGAAAILAKAEMLGVVVEGKEMSKKAVVKAEEVAEVKKEVKLMEVPLEHEGIVVKGQKKSIKAVVKAEKFA
ncbi:hypothetical protein BDZ91DRAFT_718028, partial [Kalaharituber pfeilii]